MAELKPTDADRDDARRLAGLLGLNAYSVAVVSMISVAFASVRAEERAACEEVALTEQAERESQERYWEQQRQEGKVTQVMVLEEALRANTAGVIASRIRERGEKS